MSSTRYLDIADRLAAEWADWAPGTRVASEQEIATRFGVGRAAARASVQELQRRLVVRRVQGSGTFVNNRIDYVIAQSRPPSWSATVSAAGATPRALVKEVDRVALPADRAERLERPAGMDAHRVIREFYIDDLLASRVHEWVPLDVVSNLDLALHATDSLDVILRQMGRTQPVRSWCRASIDIPPPEESRGLGTEPSQPAWLVESVSRAAEDDQVLMCSSAWTRADAVRVVVEMRDTFGSEQRCSGTEHEPSIAERE